MLTRIAGTPTAELVVCPRCGASGALLPLLLLGQHHGYYVHHERIPFVLGRLLPRLCEATDLARRLDRQETPGQ